MKADRLSLLLALANYLMAIALILTGGLAGIGYAQIGTTTVLVAFYVWATRGTR